MKNADDMLKKILKEVDTSGDGKIQYEGMVCCKPAHERNERVLTLPPRPTEFRTFVQRAERQLHDLFLAIDKDGNGKLDMKELQAAFRSASLTVSNQRLTEFFKDMDHNNDGYITFNEWRYVENVPVFIPALVCICGVMGGGGFSLRPTSCAPVGWGWGRGNVMNQVATRTATSNTLSMRTIRTVTRPHDEN